MSELVLTNDFAGGSVMVLTNDETGVRVEIAAASAGLVLELTPIVGRDAVWGEITGDINDQEDLVEFIADQVAATAPRAMLFAFAASQG